MPGKKDEQAELLKKLMQAAGGSDAGDDSDDSASSIPVDEQPPLPTPSVEEDEDGLPEGPGFMALYTTLMLLLMTFFIVLCSMNTSSQDSDKFAKATKSLKKSMGLMGMEGSRHALFFMHSVLKIHNNVILEAIEEYAPDDSEETREALSGEGAGGGFWEDGISKDEARELDKFVRMGFSIVPYDKEKKFMKVQFPLRGVFQKGSDQFEETFESSLEDLSELMRGSYSKVIIEVFTAEKPHIGLGVSTSSELSGLRAYRVAEYLKERAVLDTAVINPVGYGEYYVGHPELDDSKNEIIVMKVFDLWSSGADVVDSAAS